MSDNDEGKRLFDEMFASLGSNPQVRRDWTPDPGMRAMTSKVAANQVIGRSLRRDPPAREQPITTIHHVEAVRGTRYEQVTVLGADRGRIKFGSIGFESDGGSRAMTRDNALRLAQAIVDAAGEE